MIVNLKNILEMLFKKIENRLKFYEQNYAIKDKQDLLAMCLIEYASKSESKTIRLLLKTMVYLKTQSNSILC